ncbi:MAG: hypothetical protein PsegKO_08970 [Pseudohongiellaceae bacterium]
MLWCPDEITGEATKPVGSSDKPLRAGLVGRNCVVVPLGKGLAIPCARRLAVAPDRLE